jgi:lauroyl/myristoyl acyltransferase/2-polyprenyl-3-methyl-5-hydroxy-6-metoxy-1,4-benzoquinol methylase
MRALHVADFRVVLPWLGRLPKALGEPLSLWRGRWRAALQADWRSVALGRRHVGERSLQAYRDLAPDADDVQRLAWLRRRFATEARDEFEARWVALGRTSDLGCRFAPPDSPATLRARTRGLVLLTAHHESFILGIVFLARSGVPVNAMKSTVTHDPRVARAVSRHFEAKYAGLERHLNGGRLVDIEAGVRPIYRMLERGEVVVVLADAPVLPNGARVEVPFLGASRALAGGAVRIAEKTGSDLGAFVCATSGPRRYTVTMSAIGPARDRATVETAYGFLSDAILRDPGGWWAADLLPDMPPVGAPAEPASPGSDQLPRETPGPEAFDGASLPPYAVLSLADGALAGSAELGFGCALLRAAWRDAAAPRRWIEGPAGAPPQPAALLAELHAGGCRRLLVLAHPAVIADSSLPAALEAALRAPHGPRPLAAVAANQHAFGELPPAYVTLADFQGYVASRRALPAAEALPASLTPSVAWLDIEQALAEAQGDARQEGWEAWRELVGRRAVLAPRAYVHDYSDYRRHDRGDMLALVPAGVRRMLDVGGGEGVFARSVAQAHGCEAWVLEPDAAAAASARAAGLRVLDCSLEALGGEHDGRFELVTMLDVLEHLHDPRTALGRVRRLLAPGGALLVSTPNLGHWPVVRDLAAGRFDYLPVGTLCWTHLRFFTEGSLRALLEDAGFVVEQWTPPDGGRSPDAGLRAFVGAARAAGASVDERSLAMQTLRVRARAA